MESKTDFSASVMDRNKVRPALSYRLVTLPLDHIRTYFIYYVIILDGRFSLSISVLEWENKTNGCALLIVHRSFIVDHNSLNVAFH